LAVSSGQQNERKGNEMENKKISVIVPTYNSLKWLNRCLESISNQKYQNLEIIVVDNGSTDGTWAYLKEYKKKDPRLVPVFEEEKGTTYARNKGIQAANGDYLCFIDSDDYVLPTYCSDMIETIGDCDIAVCGIKVESEIKKNTSFAHAEHGMTVDHVEMIRKILKMEDSSHTVVNKLYRKEVIKENNIFFIEGRNYEDISYSFYTAIVSDKIVFLDESLYVYCIRNNSRSTTIEDRNGYDFTFQFEKVRDLLVGTGEVRAVLEDYKYALLYALYQLNKMFVKHESLTEAAYKENAAKLMDLIYEARYYKDSQK